MTKLKKKTSLNSIYVKSSTAFKSFYVDFNEKYLTSSSFSVIFSKAEMFTPSISTRPHRRPSTIIKCLLYDFETIQLC